MAETVIRGKIWVLTGGSHTGATGGIRKPALVRIDPETHTVEQIYEWGDQAGYPGDMKLNRDKDTLLIFYCGGLECVLSHNSAFKAEKLGYTNIRVYAEGTPDWVAKGMGPRTAAMSRPRPRAIISRM